MKTISIKKTIAAVVAGVAVVGALTFGSAISAQTPTPNAPQQQGSGNGKRMGPMGQFGRGERGAAFGRLAESPLAIAAKALSLDEAALRTELQSGKTVADLAKAKGVDVNTIVTKIVDAHKTHIAQAVADGKLTQAQADEILKNEQTRATDFVNGKVPPAGPRGPGGRGGIMGDSANSPFALAAKALSLDVTALRTELQSGKTVADLAKAKGVDVNSIVTAIVDAHKTHIAQAVTDGKLTQAQADEILKNEQTRATDFVNGKVPPAGPRGPSGRGGQGGKPQRPGAPRASATPQI